MSDSDQHERHIGKRRAFEARHVHNNRVRAFGSIAYATGYGKLDELRMQTAERRIIRDLSGKPVRNWVVERRVDTHAPDGRVTGETWVTAGRGEQCATREEADRFVRGWPGYRVRRLWRGRQGN